MDQIKIIPKNEWTKNYKVAPIYLKSKLENQSINYLKKQNYLDFKKIAQILKLNFNKKYPLGFVLKNKKNIVGFVGTLFSERKINKKNYKFCSIHTWVVNKEDRICSHMLFDILIKNKYVITVYSARNELCPTFEKMGFDIQIMKYRIVSLVNLFSFNNKNYLIEKNKTKIKNKLTKENWKIYQDHLNPSFIKFLVFDERKKSNFSFIISKIIRKKKYFNVMNILYASNEKFLKENWNSINNKLSKEFKVSFCGQYFLKEKNCSIPNNIILSLNFKKNICVKNFPTKFKFDTIYSETIY